MPQPLPTQRTKLFGLKKLRKIHQFAAATHATNKPPWVVSPHKVYTKPLQFQLPHALGRKRLLLRTDEVGKSHEQLEWAHMHRRDYDVRPKTPRLFTEQEVWQELSEMRHTKRARFIVHPTFPREKIALTGAVKIEGVVGVDGKKRILVQIDWGYPQAYDHIHRNLFEYGRSYIIDGGKIRDSLFTKRDGKTVKRNLDKKKSTQGVLRNVDSFVHTAIASGQLRLTPDRRKFAFSFLTWKNKPKELEFFDLIETVHTHPTPKGEPKE